MTSTIDIPPLVTVFARWTTITSGAVSSASLARVQVPGLIVHAMDDPFVNMRADSPRPSDRLNPRGRTGSARRAPGLSEPQAAWPGDHHWLDSRLATWLEPVLAAVGQKAQLIAIEWTQPKSGATSFGVDAMPVPLGDLAAEEARRVLRDHRG